VAGKSRKKKTGTNSLIPSMPNSIDAERALLGALMIDASALDRVLSQVKIDDFYLDSHRRLYGAIINLAERGRPADMVALTEHLTNVEELAKVGGATYLVELLEAVPSAANITHYAQIVREKAMLRVLISAASEIVDEGLGGVENAEEFFDRSESRIFEISEQHVPSNFLALKDIIHDSFEMVENLYNQGGVTGVPTGFTDIDEMTSGLQPSDLIIVAGRPSMGKTAFALNICANISIGHQIPTAIFSLEMSKEQLVMRLLCSEGRVNYADLRGGSLSEANWSDLVNAAGKLTEAPVFIDDSPGITVLDVRAKARRLMAGLKPTGKKLGLVVIDYLQLMQGSSRREASREQEISQISRSLKALARELRVPVIALSQLSRQPESRKDRRPILSDLRESGAIEQDADVIIFIYRDEVYNKDDPEVRNKAEIIIGKQRMGPTGTKKLAFLKEFTRFENLAYSGYSNDGDYE
jgi:replicative DNA helicase